MTVIGYLRCSGEDDDSIEAQRERLEAWAASRGHALVGVEEDNGISGAKDETERPGLLAALERLESGEADALAVQRLDRLARALQVQEAILDRIWRAGAHVREIVGDREVPRDDPDDPMRTFVRQVMGAATQLERGLVIARMQGGRRRKDAAGGYIGGEARYGFRVEGTGCDARLVPVPEEQEVIGLVRRLRQRGLTLRAIRTELETGGVRAPALGTLAKLVR